jgi:2'-5' RNA ligase
LVIISRLDLAEPDRRWVEAIRQRHDPQYAVVAAHFTLVFPFEGLDVDTVVTHVGAVSDTASPIDFRLVAAKVMRDPLAPRSHVFLVPDQGSSEIRTLHDRLYGGLLTEKLRADIPYEPHVTVGAFCAHGGAERAAIEIGAVNVAGRLSMLDLAEFDQRQVTYLHRLQLNDTGRRRRVGRRRRS